MRMSLGSIVVLAASLTAQTAAGTTLAQMNLDDLVASASVIAHVRCLNNQARWENGEIWTFSEFEVLESLKGNVPGIVTVRLLGGRVGHLVSSVAGVPRFAPGEEVVLFLESTRAGDFSVTGWVEGTFRVRRDVVSGRASVTQDSSHFAVFDPATRQYRPIGVRTMPLGTFRQRVAAALMRERGKLQP